MSSKPEKTCLLLIEDEEAIRDMLRFAIPEQEFHLLEAADTASAMRVLSETLPHAIILDWMLPVKSGIHFLAWLRKEPLYKHIPVIMLTAKAESDNKIKALSMGVDDYVVKPFSVEELLARVRAILRRGLLVSTDHEILFKELLLNVETNSVFIQGKPLTLTANEYRILHFFITHTKQVYSRAQLLDHIFGQNKDVDERAVDTQIKRLRKKLEPFAYERYLKTQRGMGYYFSEDDHA